MLPDSSSFWEGVVNGVFFLGEVEEVGFGVLAATISAYIVFFGVLNGVLLRALVFLSISCWALGGIVLKSDMLVFSTNICGKND